MQQASEARAKDELDRYRPSLENFHQAQLARAQRVGEMAEELLAFVEGGLRHHLGAGSVLQGRELPAVLNAACKALEAAMNSEATALGVAGLLEDLSS